MLFRSKALRGIETADSIALDPHKSLSIPYGTGCLLVKNKAALSYQYAGSPTYMPPSPGVLEDFARMDFADITPELSRDFRGLRMWLPLKTFGIAPFQLNLEEKLKLAQYFSASLKQNPQVTVITEPQLSIVNFKLKDSAMTRDLLTRINQTHKFFLSGCTLNNEFVIRVCLLGFRSHYQEVEQLLAIITNTLKEMKA